jgi:CheY-like chemotaxis protein
VRLSVTDTGTGMDADTIAKAIEPFFTTKGVGQGTGLGLSMVHGLAAQLGGGLAIESESGKGTRIDLWLPITDAEPDRTLPSPHLDHFRRGRGIVMVVDDEDLVRASTAHMLVELGYTVVEAHSAEEALSLLDGSDDIDLLVTDHMMPGITGTDLAMKLRKMKPDIRVLLVSGYAEGKGISPDLPRLTKPFKQRDLAISLAQL